MLNRLKNIIALVPDLAGIYSMKDKSGKVIYVGKAKSLKKRLTTYLARDVSRKTIALLLHVYDIEYRLCPNEGMALLLEASLIHKYKPKYNVSLRDDKSFPYVKITDEDFPAIYITRKKEFDQARYLGPYANAKLLRQALKLIRRNFPYRSCKRLPKKACIYWRLKLSPAPCIGKINKAEYAKSVEGIALILSGKTDNLMRKLSKTMESKSKEHRFEEAAKIRDQIISLSAINMVYTVYAARSEVADLKNLLKMDKLPRRIEAFDISNISGKDAAGSMVSFYQGVPDKHNYRRFRIKTIEGIDDYAMLREVIRRRYLRLLAEDLPLPDLILIDGGRSHLAAAEEEIKGLGLNLSLVSIAKDRENIYIKDNLNPINLASDTPALNLIRRIRDEAHRFALSYHHLLRRKKVIGR